MVALHIVPKEMAPAKPTQIAQTREHNQFGRSNLIFLDPAPIEGAKVFKSDPSKNALRTMQ